MWHSSREHRILYYARDHLAYNDTAEASILVTVSAVIDPQFGQEVWVFFSARARISSCTAGGMMVDHIISPGPGSIPATPPGSGSQSSSSIPGTAFRMIASTLGSTNPSPLTARYASDSSEARTTAVTLCPVTSAKYARPSCSDLAIILSTKSRRPRARSAAVSNSRRCLSISWGNRWSVEGSPVPLPSRAASASISL